MSLLINKYWISTHYIEFNLFEKNVVILFVMDINKINYFANNINCFASISPTHICYTLCAKFLLFTLLNNLIMRSWRGRMVVGLKIKSLSPTLNIPGSQKTPCHKNATLIWVSQEGDARKGIPFDLGSRRKSERNILPSSWGKSILIISWEASRAIKLASCPIQSGQRP